MTKERKSTVNDAAKKSSDGDKAPQTGSQPDVKEHGGRDGPDPVRYGDWELDGKCVDF